MNEAAAPPPPPHTQTQFREEVQAVTQVPLDFRNGPGSGLFVYLPFSIAYLQTVGALAVSIAKCTR
jgi:hypothetical protein